MSLAKSCEDRRVRAFGPDGVLWRRRFTLEKAEHHVRLKRAVAQRNSRTGRITSIHFTAILGSLYRLNFSARYAVQSPAAERDRRVWVHRQLPAVPVAFGLSESEFPEHVNLARRLAFQAVTASVLVEQRPTPPAASELAQAA